MKQRSKRIQFRTGALLARWLAVLAVVLAGQGFSGFGQTISNVPLTVVQLTDDFSNRPAISVSPDTNLPYANSWDGEVYGNVSNATFEADEPYITGVSSGQTVWGTWTPPFTVVGPPIPPSGAFTQKVRLIQLKGTVTMSVWADSFSPLLTVYTGDDLPSLALVASNNYEACYSDGDCGCHWRERSQITFHVAAGQAYQICVDSAIITDAAWGVEQLPAGTYPSGAFQWAYQLDENLNGTIYWPFYVVQQTTNIPAGGPFTLDLQFTASPPNDDFANRLKLSGTRISLLAPNAGANKEVGEPDYGGNSGGSSVWYSWTAPASGRVTISTNAIAAYAPPSSGDGSVYGEVSTIYYVNPTPTCGDEFDQNPPPVFYPVFGVYTGTNVAALTTVNVLPLGLAAYPYALEFDAVKGQTYQIAFDGNQGATGIIPLYLELTTPPANSVFKNRLQLHGVSVAASAYNAGAVHQAGEPFLPGSIGKNVWWSWTAPVTGVVSLDLTGSDYAFPVGVFTGLSPAGLQVVAEGVGTLAFNAVQGVTYQIAVGDAEGLTGAIALSLEGPVVDLALERKQTYGNVLYLNYGSTFGEVVALLSSTDQTQWTIAQTKTAQQKTVQFEVHPASAAKGVYFRAIIFDRTGE